MTKPVGGTPVYQMDPDFRRDSPDGKPYCVCCQRGVDPAKAIRVTVDWDRWMVTEGGDELMGKDCWKRMVANAEAQK